MGQAASSLAWCIGKEVSSRTSPEERAQHELEEHEPARAFSPRNPREQPQPRSNSSNSAESTPLQLSTEVVSKPEPSSTLLPAYVLKGSSSRVEDKYAIGEQIGCGQYGVVRMATDKATGTCYAIKSISKLRAQQDQLDYLQRIRTEVEVLYTLGGHPNVVQLYECFETDDTFHLILELCEGGDWFEQLLSSGAFTEAQAAMAVRSVLRTLMHCHSMGVAHRDIKPENLLYTDRTPDAAIKLADFGLSAMVPLSGAVTETTYQQPGSSALLRKVVGSPMYIAPEALTSHGVNKERDIWSLGIVMFITLSGYPPFEGNKLQEVFDAILNQGVRFDDPCWQLVSDEAKDFISRMLCKDPKQRATIQQLLAHPWLLQAASINSEQGPHNMANARAVPDAVVTRLHQFTSMSHFKKEARRVVSSFLPKEAVAGLRNLFSDMDANGDGLVTLEELRAALRSKKLRITEMQSKEMLRCADINRNGVLDYDEFLAATIHQGHLAKDELMLSAFQHFDRDGSGFITPQELRAALSCEELEVDVDAILRNVDTNHDNLISHDEFCRYLRQRTQAQSGEELWPLLSGSLSMRNPLATSRSLCSRPSLIKHASSKRRQRMVHFQEAPLPCLDSSLRSVAEDADAAVIRSESRNSRGSQPSTTALGSTARSQPAAGMPEFAAAGRRSLRLSRSDSGASSLMVPLVPRSSQELQGQANAAMAEDRLKAHNERKARISARRRSAHTKSVMLDEQLVEAMIANSGCWITAPEGAEPKPGPAAARPAALCEVSGLPRAAHEALATAAGHARAQALLRDASPQQGPQTPCRASRKGSLRVRVAGTDSPRALGATTDAGDGSLGVAPFLSLTVTPRGPVPPTTPLGPGPPARPLVRDHQLWGAIQKPLNSPAGHRGGTSIGSPAQTVVPPATTPSPPAGLRVQHGARGMAEANAVSPAMQPTPHAPVQYACSPLSQCSGRHATSPQRCPRPSSRYRSPAHRSLSRSRPSRGRSRASSCSSSCASSRGRSRGRSYCSSSSAGPSRASSVGRQMQALEKELFGSSCLYPLHSPLGSPGGTSPRQGAQGRHCETPQGAGVGSTWMPSPRLTSGTTPPSPKFPTIFKDNDMQPPHVRPVHRLGSVSHTNSVVSPSYQNPGSHHAQPNPSSALRRPTPAMIASLLAELEGEAQLDGLRLEPMVS